MTSNCIIENDTRDSRLIFGRVTKEYLEIGLETPHAATHIKVFMYTDMPLLTAFFKEIAANWKGWQGIKKFCSVERDFCVEASHNGIAVVCLKIMLSSVTSTGVEGELRVSMNLECGALENIANLVGTHLSKSN